jgi:CPA1 family monovalent cation:H+ antiporter
MHDNLRVDLFVTLLMIAAGVSMTVKWVKLPYSIALVIVGLLIGLFDLLPKISMTPDLILLVCLPALLFEASWNIHLDELKASWKPVAAFATFGVLISMVVVGLILHYFVSVPLGPAFLLGAIISATDPISVVALFRHLGIDKRLIVILEGESLFNDGTAVVLFKLILTAVLAGSAISIPSTFASFIVVVIGGAAVGCALGFVSSKLTSFFDDHLLEITLTTILAYGSYLLSEHLQVSPVIAVVCAGIVMGNYGSRTSMSPTTRLAVNSFWEYAAFVVNSLVFLMIGLQIKLSLLSEYIMPIVITIVAVILARMLGVYGLSACLSNSRCLLPWKWRHLLVWGGLRGALCMALALSLPHEFPQRELIIVVTFGVVLFTLLVPGLTMEPLVRVLQISADKSFATYQRLKAQLMVNILALELLERKQALHTISDMTYKYLEERLRLEQRELRQSIEMLHLTDDSIQKIDQARASCEIREFQKDQLAQLVKTGGLSGEAAHEIAIQLDQEYFSND